MKKNYKDIFWGIILVALGVVLILAKLGVMPWLEAIPVGRLIATIILLAISITGITDRNVFVTLIPISLIACLFDEELHITAITPWVLIIATVLVCIGITKIFPNKNVKVVYDGHSYGTFNGPSDGNEGTTFDSNVSISNTFGETTKYISGSTVVNVNANNTFGQTNIYMNNATVPESGCIVYVKNSFGEINLHLPQSYNVEVRSKKAFGEVSVRNNFIPIANAPTIIVEADCSFGDINIY